MKTINIACGTDILAATWSAISCAERHNEECRFKFNGVWVVVAKDSRPQLLFRDWRRAMNGFLGSEPTVGPHPSEHLSEEELASDARIAAENERKQHRQQAICDRERADKAAQLKHALAFCGPLKIRKNREEDWQTLVESNKDPYGARVVRFAEEWGRLMQQAIENGSSLSDVAKDMSDLANDDCITGFQYGTALGILIQLWEYGDQLREWYEKK